MKSLTQFNMFVDGKGYAGKAEELTPPKMALKMEEIRAAGMDAPVEIETGMEKMETSFNLIGIDKELLAKFGVATGESPLIRFKGAQRDTNGSVEAIDIEMKGKIKEMDLGSWKSGDKANLKVSATLDYFKMSVDGKPVIEIDVPNMIRKIDGKDQLADIRKALGM